MHDDTCPVWKSVAIALLLVLLPTVVAHADAGENKSGVAQTSQSRHPYYYLHNGEFAVRLWVYDPNRNKWVDGRPSWITKDSILFYAFSRSNPEVMIKLLDGRKHNGHWWGDFASMSDLKIVLRVWNMRTREYWNVQSSRALDQGATGDRRRVVCASPHYNNSKTDGYNCAWGAGTSSREAWRDDGRIPAKFWVERIVGYLE